MKYTVQLIEDGDELILPLPEELLAELGWVEGDTLVWSDSGDGTFTIRKENELDEIIDEIKEGGC
jgi:hypothetical protein